PHSIKSGAWSPEAFLLNLAHFGFVFAIVRDAASLLGLALRVPAKDTVRRVATEIAAADVPHSSPAAKKSSVLERVALRFDAQVAWALLGVLAAAVVNVALPDASLLPYVLTGTLGMAIFAASVPLHAAAAPPLALALMGKGLAWPAGFLLVWLAPLSAELDWKRRVPLAALGALSLELAARFWALPSPVMPTGFGTPAAALFLVLVAYRAYRVGLRGLLATVAPHSPH
ncbi:MAG TPA: hypothetical protein VFQ61_14415, partial [Polyangiaceae bacterium]|nr:hypothetical protein [Polyangiaceae bacterium]